MINRDSPLSSRSARTDDKSTRAMRLLPSGNHANEKEKKSTQVNIDRKMSGETHDVKKNDDGPLHDEWKSDDTLVRTRERGEARQSWSTAA